MGRGDSIGRGAGGGGAGIRRRSDLRRQHRRGELIQGGWAEPRDRGVFLDRQATGLARCRASRCRVLRRRDVWRRRNGRPVRRRGDRAAGSWLRRQPNSPARHHHRDNAQHGRGPATGGLSVSGASSLAVHRQRRRANRSLTHAPIGDSALLAMPAPPLRSDGLPWRGSTALDPPARGTAPPPTSRPSPQSRRSAA
jgi:hypothetical protein